MRLVVHSIDVMDDICKQTNNALGLNRNGYLFVTRDVNKMEQLKQLAKNLERHGGGELRPVHHGGEYLTVVGTLEQNPVGFFLPVIYQREQS
ncbi:hypothetical protein PR003_g18634 [Phytophthora rubi]|uniref:Uncharacterized protein n=1 Tax=Phytophthora rubi TaxID=129364 RepID=A0A6A4DZ56_9STRA|nr:hypothetical protein PR003_g18634 [Phytophthora rubi]